MNWKRRFPKENIFYETENGILYQGHVLEILKKIPDESIDCVVTSPPYYALRNYGEEANIVWGGDPKCEHEWEWETKRFYRRPSDKSKLCGGNGANPKWEKFEEVKVHAFCKKCGAWYGQLGLEPHFEMYLEHLWQIFDEIYRILKPTGTLWVNLGDSYNGSGKAGVNPEYQQKHKNFGKEAPKETLGTPLHLKDYPRKCLLMIPERFAIGMIERGWILRNQIIWHKPNALPECLHPETKVYIKKNGYIRQIPIKNVEKGDLILTPNGWKRVIDKWFVKKKGIKFRAGRVDEVICSHEHRFAVVKDTHRDRNVPIHFLPLKDVKSRNHKLLYADISRYFDGSINRLDVTEISDIDWFVPLDTLSEEDKQKLQSFTPLEIAKVIEDKSLKKYNVSSNKWTYGSNIHNEIRRGRIRSWKLKKLGINKFQKVSAKGSQKVENRFFELNYDLGWLIGLYCAEGGFNQPRGYQGKITLSSKEMNLVNKFINKLREIFGVEASLIRKSNYIDIIFSSATFYAIAKFLVGGKCRDKNLNLDFMLNTPREFRAGFIDGYIDGDGYRRNNGFIVASASDTLIKQIQYLLSSIGILTSISRSIRKDKRTGKEYKATTLWTNSNYKYDLLQQYSPVRVNNIVEIDEEMEFVDIEVEGHVFIVENGLVSHNSVKDRFTNDYEKIFFFVKEPKYYFKQILELYTSPLNRWSGEEMKDELPSEWDKATGQHTHRKGNLEPKTKGRNKRTVWSIPTKGVKEAHFAVFPPEIPETCITAGCPPEGIVLDPFMGSGTTGMVAEKLGRKWIGIEINPEYCKIAEKRIEEVARQRRLFPVP